MTVIIATNLTLRGLVATCIKMRVFFKHNPYTDSSCMNLFAQISSTQYTRLIHGQGDRSSGSSGRSSNRACTSWQHPFLPTKSSSLAVYCPGPANSPRRVTRARRRMVQRMVLVSTTTRDRSAYCASLVPSLSQRYPMGARRHYGRLVIRAASLWIPST